jgi:hypothetical protein
MRNPAMWKALAHLKRNINSSLIYGIILLKDFPDNHKINYFAMISGLTA